MVGKLSQRKKVNSTFRWVLWEPNHRRLSWKKGPNMGEKKPQIGETQGTHHKMEKQLNFGESRMRGQGSVLPVHVWGQVCTEMCPGKPVYSAYRGLGHKVHGFSRFLA